MIIIIDYTCNNIQYSMLYTIVDGPQSVCNGIETQKVSSQITSNYVKPSCQGHESRCLDSD